MYRRALHNAKVLEAKRNGGLDLLKTAVSVSDTGKRTKFSARQRFFLFPAVEADVLICRYVSCRKGQNIPC